MREEKAVEYFKNGFNCAQAVLTVFAKEYGLDEVIAPKITCGFGAGMGRMQNTCGAVTGAFMAIGLKYGKSLGDEGNEKRDKTYALVRSFDSEIKEKFGTTSCRELMNCDLTTPEGSKYAIDNNLSEKVCQRCVREAVLITEKLL
jgi:C_GCAxxG_C_C family probable redox protein